MIDDYSFSDEDDEEYEDDLLFEDEEETAEEEINRWLDSLAPMRWLKVMREAFPEDYYPPDELEPDDAWFATIDAELESLADDPAYWQSQKEFEEQLEFENFKKH